jgi:hypothetical protein
MLGSGFNGHSGVVSRSRSRCESAGRTGRLCLVPLGPILRRDDVVLRPPATEDVDGRRVLGYDPEILRMFGVSTPVDPSMTTGQAAAWVASLGKDGEIEWVVEHAHRLLGSARLHSFETGDRCRYAVGFFDQAKLGHGSAGS